MSNKISIFKTTPAEDEESNALRSKGTAKPPKDTHLRSLLKGLTWRILATSTTMSIAWIITGQVQLAMEIGFIEFFAKLFIYYFHERVWARYRV